MVKRRANDSDDDYVPKSKERRSCRIVAGFQPPSSTSATSSCGTMILAITPFSYAQEGSHARIDEPFSSSFTSFGSRSSQWSQGFNNSLAEIQEGSENESELSDNQQVDEVRRKRDIVIEAMDQPCAKPWRTGNEDTECRRSEPDDENTKLLSSGSKDLQGVEPSAGDDGSRKKSKYFEFEIFNEEKREFVPDEGLMSDGLHQSVLSNGQQSSHLPLDTSPTRTIQTAEQKGSILLGFLLLLETNGLFC